MGTTGAFDNRLISLITKLQEACTQLGDFGVEGGDDALPSLYNALPQIAVVGGQSAGKSSVLEAVVGKDFLPRNAGICTRRPLVFNLVKSDDEYGEFGHLKGRKLRNFEDVRKEIEAETDRAVGKGRNVSPVPIYLTVYSPDVVNLTLVDLPGLTKVATEGQSESIVHEIEDMVKEYVSKPNCIMLTVSPANADLANSDGLRLAKEVDPTGERTFGVLTKLDLMDEGTDAREILMGDTYKTRFPFVGVVNRSQKDLNGNMDMVTARRKEKEYFETHPQYKDISFRMGTAFLAKSLGDHLLAVIKEKVPMITNLVNTQAEELEKQIAGMGQPLPKTRGGMMNMALEMCRKFEKSFGDKIDKEGGGEQLFATFHTKLGSMIDDLPFDRFLHVREVSKAIQASDGYQPHIIAPEMGYRRLIQDTLKLLASPADNIVQEIHSILVQYMEKTIASEDLSRFGMMQTKLSATANKALVKLRDEARKIVGTMVEMERSHISADFFRTLPTDPDMESVTGTEGIDRRTEAVLRRMASNVAKYVADVCFRLKQTIPKVIVHCQIETAKKNLLDGLYVNIGAVDETGLIELLSESPEMAQKRAQLEKRLELLNIAKSEIKKVIN
mmetsp:Transcript_7648/g.28161  ORF Transcript_7648/g.28161 Transcript_7648/m.28161 type:complete len:614 (-) Transcript_7648:640-2481(-)